MNRRNFLRFTTGVGVAVGLDYLIPAYAKPISNLKSSPKPTKYPDIIDLQIQETRLKIGDRNAEAITVNGSIPAPLIRLREGQTATIRVTNHLKQDTSIHWHGLILPYEMDGVPGIGFKGIKPGETFTYQFPVVQSGTYWYHSHSGLQEQQGHFGPIIIDPIEPDPVKYDKDYVVMLSDWTFENPHQVLANLKKMSAYYNTQRRTVAHLFKDLDWRQMRMDPTDIADVTGATYTYLMNGLAPESNWTALFKPGEKVRLRFINSSAMTFFDVRIPGLKMTVVQADGQNVKPVTVDEFRIGVAETYDVIVQPQQEQAYTIFAETMDRSGYARGTLAIASGINAPLPERRQRPIRSMKDMGHGDHDMSGMDHSSTGHDMPEMDHSSTGHDMPEMDHSSTGHDMSGMDHSSTGHDMSGMDHSSTGHDMSGMDHSSTGHDMSEMDHSSTGHDHHMSDAEDMHSTENQELDNVSEPMMTQSRLHEPGIGLENTGTRVLVYTDLQSLSSNQDQRKPDREIELYLTGNMERYMWSFNGKKYSQEKEIAFYKGERLRLTFINDTMMEHPIHLHGMWMELDNGSGQYKPRKHTIIVKPAEKLSVEINVDVSGQWPLHCHLLYHMKVGMFRTVTIGDRPVEAS
ncbi:copper resistance system multicopper oxidase [Gloeothece citriformis]|uniref:copper resistance system multicopper oxidase n=1 Tax=Gloeothece citriformis TaxID=2546356 RepID=UPI00032509E2|nr:copper resistance system multicopper oxidase [Gloeothece citriformis]